MERYRSGHNEAVLKTVCPKGRVGSNPTLSALRTEAERLPFCLVYKSVHARVIRRAPVNVFVKGPFRIPLPELKTLYCKKFPG